MVNIRHSFYVTLIHPIISILVPFILLHSLILVLANFFIKAADISIFPPLYWLLLLLVGGAETTMANFLYRSRNSGAAPRLREIALVIIGGAIAILMLNGDLFRWDIDPKRISFWLPLIFIPLQWILTFYVHGKLRYRELFLHFFEGKEESQVYRTYQDFNHEASESYQQMRILKQLISGFMILIFMAWTIVEWGVQPDFGIYQRGSLLVAFFLYLVIIYALNGFGHQQQVMMDGFIISQAQRRRRWFVILTVVGAIALIAIPLIGQEALLPEQYLLDLFYWISNLLTFEETEGRVQELRFGSQLSRMPEMEMLSMLDDQQDTKRIDMRWLMRIIGWNLLGLLLLGVVVFLIYPLLKGFRRGERPSDILKNSFKTLVKNLSDTFSTLKESISVFLAARKDRAFERESERKRAREKRKRKTDVEAALPRAKSRKERRFYSRVVKGFLKFAKWGEQRGIPFSRTLGPLEYAGMVGSEVPERSSSCHVIAEMFEEIQFSGRPPAADLTQRYLKGIKDITKKL